MLDKIIILFIGVQVFFRSSFFDVRMIPVLDVGGANSIGVQDLSYFILFSAVFMKILSGRKNALRWGASDKLFSLFLFMGVVGVVNSIVTGTGFHLAAREAREFFLYALYFAVLSLNPTESHIKRLTTILVGLAILTSLFSILQVTSGDRIGFLFGKIITLRTLGEDIEGVTRVSSGGLASINFAFFVCLASLLHKADKKNLVLFGILSVATFISFNRGMWVSMILAVLALYPFIGGKLRDRYLKILLILGLSGAMLLGAGGLGVLGSKIQQYTEAGVSRFMSVMPGQIEEDGSTLGRLEETKIVFEKFKLRPWIGHGLGAITQENIMIRGEKDHSERVSAWGYVHNGYLYVLFKLGIFGLVIFLAFMYVFIRRTIGGVKYIYDERLKSVYLGSFLFIVSILPHSLASPRIMEGNYITVIAIALGLIELIRFFSLGGKQQNGTKGQVARGVQEKLPLLRRKSSSGAS